MTDRYIGLDLTINDHSSLENFMTVGIRTVYFNFIIFDPQMKDNDLLYEKISMLRELEMNVQIISHKENAPDNTWWIGEKSIQ